MQFPARGRDVGLAESGFALLWELSSYRKGLQLSFHFFGGDLSCVELWVERLALVASYLGYAVSCWLRPSNLLSVSASGDGSHYALYEHIRGKRAHPIYQRVLAQGRSRARAAYQSLCSFQSQ